MALEGIASEGTWVFEAIAFIGSSRNTLNEWLPRDMVIKYTIYTAARY